MVILGSLAPYIGKASILACLLIFCNIFFCRKFSLYNLEILQNVRVYVQTISKLYRRAISLFHSSNQSFSSPPWHTRLPIYESYHLPFVIIHSFYINCFHNLYLFIFDKVGIQLKFFLNSEGLKLVS